MINQNKVSTKESFYLVALFLGLGLALSLSLVFAWSEPSQTPPACPSGEPGCDAPINVSSTAQTKAGDLTIKTTLYADDVRLGNWGGVVTSAGNLDIKNSTGGTVLQFDGSAGKIVGNVPCATPPCFGTAGRQNLVNGLNADYLNGKNWNDVLGAAGGGTPQYIGATPTLYTGNLGGVIGANAKCNAVGGNFAGSHICTYEEFVRTGRNVPLLSNGWINDGLYIKQHRGSDECGDNDFCTFSKCAHQAGAGYYGGAVPDKRVWNCATSSINGAGNWKTNGSTYYGCALKTNGSIVAIACNTSMPIHCCK